MELTKVLRNARGVDLPTLHVGICRNLCDRRGEGNLSDIGVALNATRVRAMAAIVKFQLENDEQASLKLNVVADSRSH